MTSSWGRAQHGHGAVDVVLGEVAGVACGARRWGPAAVLGPVATRQSASRAMTVARIGGRTFHLTRSLLDRYAFQTCFASATPRGAYALSIHRNGQSQRTRHTLTLVCGIELTSDVCARQCLMRVRARDQPGTTAPTTRGQPSTGLVSASSMPTIAFVAAWWNTAPGRETPDDAGLRMPSWRRPRGAHWSGCGCWCRSGYICDLHLTVGTPRVVASAQANQPHRRRAAKT